MAYALSRAPLRETGDSLREGVQAYVQMIITSLPASEQQLENIREQQEMDSECSRLKELCQRRNLTWDMMRGTLKQYYPVRDELNVADGILMRGQRMIIPTSLRKLMLSKLHSIHQGVTKCKERANQSVWWPGIRKQIEEVVHQCPTCCKCRKQRPEPLIPSQFPKYPWQVDTLTGSEAALIYPGGSHTTCGWHNGMPQWNVFTLQKKRCHILDDSCCNTHNEHFHLWKTVSWAILAHSG